MLGLSRKTDWKFFGAEVGFLIFMAYGCSIISDLEYSYYEEHNIWNFVHAFEYRAVIGTFMLLFYGTYYLGFLKCYVFKRRLIPILLSIVLFIVFYHLYEKYVMNWSISKMPFVSDSLRKRALKDYKRPHIYFTVNYILNLVIMPIIGFAFVIRSLQQDEQMKTLKEQQLISELNYLKAQIHPHFFFNTLNNIYSLALKQSTATAPMVARLSEMMRYILYETNQKTVLLSRELQFLSNYIAVEKIRHPDAHSIQFDVQGISNQVYIEPLLLLPFVENAFKHGLQQETMGGFVNIVVCLAESELTLEITNSKPSQNKTETDAGIGLQNVVKRLDILYGDKYELDIKDEAADYRLFLTLQIK